jgi:hypothetical protein
VRITFDTNTLDRAARPARFPKDPRQPEYLKVHQALHAGKIEGFFCDTLVTLEGIQNKDRGAVFGSTDIRSQRDDSEDDTGRHVVKLTLVVEQRRRQPLHPEAAARVQAALAIGMRVLGAPRIGSPRIEDTNNAIYVFEPDESLLALRLEKFMEAARAIEARGIGAAQGISLAQQFATRDGVTEHWYLSLQRASNIHEEKAVQRAVAEWADGDSIAAHIGYGRDLFCTEDQGNSAGGASIFDATNRAWLTSTFGVKFIGLSDLALIV